MTLSETLLTLAGYTMSDGEIPDVHLSIDNPSSHRYVEITVKNLEGLITITAYDEMPLRRRGSPPDIFTYAPMCEGLTDAMQWVLGAAERKV